MLNNIGPMGFLFLLLPIGYFWAAISKSKKGKFILKTRITGV
jgi:hypothetical protein